MIENIFVIAINISVIKDVTYMCIQYVVLYDGPEAYMYEIKLCYVQLCIFLPRDKRLTSQYAFFIGVISMVLLLHDLCGISG